VYYLFVCRVVLGIFIRTQSGDKDAKDLDEGIKVFATQKRRELAAIPGIIPPTHFHSLLVELGVNILRYREFIQFHSQRVYPEYLLAYQRAHK